MAAAVGLIALASLLALATPAQASVDDSPPTQVEQITPGDPIIHADDPDSSDNLRGTPRCGSKAYFPPFGSYGPISQATCAFAGSPGAKVGYTWSVNPHSSSEACASGLGYNTARSPVYYGLGCGTKGAKDVAWGNVLGYQKLKAYAIGVLTGGEISWY